MPRKPEGTGEADVRFTEHDLAVLRDIVTDWMYEQLVQPPYPPEVAAVIEKIGIPGAGQGPEGTQAIRSSRGAGDEEEGRLFEQEEIPLRPNLG
jgi:hypothetical protein